MILKGVITITDSNNNKSATHIDKQIHKFDRILNANPDDLSALMAYAEANLRKGNRFEAMKAYQKLIELRPDVSDVRVALSKIYYSMSHHKDALIEITNIFQKDHRNIEAHILLRRIDREIGLPDEMLDMLKEHLLYSFSTTRINRMKTQFEIEKRKYEKLITEYDRQLQEDEGNPVILYNRSKAFERVRWAEETLEDLDNMIGEDSEEFPSVDAEYSSASISILGSMQDENDAEKTEEVEIGSESEADGEEEISGEKKSKKKKETQK